MEEKRHILDYLAQIMVIFGSTLLVISVICGLVGTEARNVSTMFALGSDGIPLRTIFQYLLTSVCIVGLRILYFTDAFIKKMPTVLRTVSMLLSVIACIGLFSWRFGWFAVSDPFSWGIFLACFAVCFVVSLLVSMWRERLNNRRLAEALKKLKETDYDQID